MIHLQTRYLSYKIGEDGQNVSFSDPATGVDLLKPSPCAILTDANRVAHNAVSCRLDGDVLTIGFEGGETARVQVTNVEEYLKFTLLSLSDETAFRVAFVNVSINGDHPDFVAALMPMTINAKPEEYPGISRLLRCEAYPHVGVANATGALIAAPKSELRRIMGVVTNDIPEDELPRNLYGGAFALDHTDKGATRPYTILPQVLNLEEAEEFACAMERFGMKQVNLHPGYGMYAHGSFEPNKEVYGDLDGFRKLVDTFHRHNIQVCLQTYTFFVGHDSSFVTPVPHKDLGYIAEFTLAEDLPIDADAVPVLETTEKVDPLAGNKIPGSAILWIDDELIHFNDAAKTAPYGFTGCERGFNKTVPSAHKKGAKVKILLGRFLVLAPKKESPLFFEVARRMADFYNTVGADGFYLDAIDGIYILDGNEFAWYHSMLFLRELFKHLKKPAVFDCCYGPQYPSTWFLRSRMGVLDAPTRAYRDFIDVHVDYCRENANRKFLVPGMGWKNLFPGDADILLEMDAKDHKENTLGWQNKLWFTEDVEYLCVKGLAIDACMSYQNVFSKADKAPVLLRYGQIMAQYDRIRTEHTFPKALTDMLAQPQSEFHLEEKNGKPVFYRQKTQRLHADVQRPTVCAYNPYTTQKPFLRLEGLYTAGEYDSPDAAVIGWDESVTLNEEKVYHYQVRHDTEGRHALGVRICGDNSGAMLCIRIRNKMAGKLGANEFFIKLDFEGWRYYTFYEAQNGERPHEEWPRCELKYEVYDDVEVFYEAYTHVVNYATIDLVELRLSKPCQAVMEPLHLMQHRQSVWEQPTLTVNGQSVTLPITLKSGQFAEVTADGDGTLYTLGGHELAHFRVAPLTLQSGDNAVTLSAASASELARAAITFRYLGQPVNE